jgi:hypothetical protein
VAKGLVNFFIVSSTSVALMSIVVGSKAKNAPLSKPHYFNNISLPLVVDSPIVTKDDLPYPFNDNN